MEYSLSIEVHIEVHIDIDIAIEIAIDIDIAIDRAIVPKAFIKSRINYLKAVAQYNIKQYELYIEIDNNL